MLADGQAVPLDANRTWLLGRGTACDVVLDDPSLGEVHALLHVEGHRVVVEDRSSGWTFVDGVEITHRALGHGDKVVVGSVPLRLEVPPPAAVVDAVPERVVVPAAAPPNRPPADPPAGPSHGPGDDPLSEPLAATAAASAPGAPEGEASTPATKRARAVGAFFAQPLGVRPLREDTPFSELMADELRRAPWFALSLVLHVLVFLILLWLLPDEKRGGQRSARIGLAGVQGSAEEEAFDPSDEAIVVEEAEDAPPLEPESLEFDEGPDFSEQDFVDPNLPGDLQPSELLLAKVGQKRPSNELFAGGGGLDTGGFRETVSELEASGLELVFVFDSTGSMDRVLDATKQRIVRTLDVLQTLVHGARVGVVTYRDHGQQEDYLTRSIPLDDDYYRAINFVQGIRADGGRDEPEAVFDGLQIALDQPWRSGAKRVVILVGDAEAHSRSMPALERMIRSFSAKGISQVHTVVTPRTRFSDPVPSAIRNFARIAAAGRGDAVTFEDDATLLQQVLTLAFGKEYRENIDEVYRIVEQRRSRIEGDAARAVASPHRLLEVLAQRPVAHDVVQAAIQRGGRDVALGLLDAMADPDFPSHGRHAAAYIIQRLLELPAPPIDPETEAVLTRPELLTLRGLTRKQIAR